MCKKREIGFFSVGLNFMLLNETKRILTLIKLYFGSIRITIKLEE